MDTISSVWRWDIERKYLNCRIVFSRSGRVSNAVARASRSREMLCPSSSNPM